MMVTKGMVTKGMVLAFPHLPEVAAPDAFHQRQPVKAVINQMWGF